MNMPSTASGTSSVVLSNSDLDGYSLPSFAFTSGFSAEQDEFGFDPPSDKAFNTEHNYHSPPQDPNDPLSLSGWSTTDLNKDNFQPASVDRKQRVTDSYDGIDKIISHALPNATRTISRHGQLTPPRSNSTSSDQSGQNVSPKSTVPERKRRATIKAQVKEEASPPVNAVTTGRKRKNSRKSIADINNLPEEDDKRRQSLEKNRLAAAKCRVNKKEKTEQLQRDSHDKAVHNAFLKEQVMRMKEEVQQMNAILLAHANCDGCMKPDEIQKHLSHLGTEFFSQRMSTSGPSYSEYPQMALDDLSQMHGDMMQGDYFSPQSNSNSGNLHPPLPDFDRSADFEVQTPMYTD